MKLTHVAQRNQELAGTSRLSCQVGDKEFGGDWAPQVRPVDDDMELCFFAVGVHDYLP